MAKKFCRRLKKSSEFRIDIRSLSFEEYRMLSELVRAASESFDKGYKTVPVGSFDISYIDTRVFAPLGCFNKLAKLSKLFGL